MSIYSSKNTSLIPAQINYNLNTNESTVRDNDQCCLSTITDTNCCVSTTGCLSTSCGLSIALRRYLSPTNSVPTTTTGISTTNCVPTTYCIPTTKSNGLYTNNLPNRLAAAVCSFVTLINQLLIYYISFFNTLYWYKLFYHVNTFID